MKNTVREKIGPEMKEIAQSLGLSINTWTKQLSKEMGYREEDVKRYLDGSRNWPVEWSNFDKLKYSMYNIMDTLMDRPSSTDKSYATRLLKKAFDNDIEQADIQTYLEHLSSQGQFLKRLTIYKLNAYFDFFSSLQFEEIINLEKAMQISDDELIKIMMKDNNPIDLRELFQMLCEEKMFLYLKLLHQDKKDRDAARKIDSEKCWKKILKKAQKLDLLQLKNYFSFVDFLVQHREGDIGIMTKAEVLSLIPIKDKGTIKHIMSIDISQYGVCLFNFTDK